ncbi:LTA synthase family protein [Tissierellaceae bacterium HCP3S3_D8]
MFLAILLTIKFIFFTYLIKVEFNRIPIIVVSSLISTIILSLIFRSKTKNKETKALIFYTIISLIILADVAYYSHFNVLPKVLVIKQFKQLTAVGESLKKIFNFKILLLILDIPIIAYIMKRTNYSAKIDEKIRKKAPIILGVMLFAVLISINSKGYLATVKAQELYTYHITDITETILGKNKVTSKIDALTQEDIEELKSRARLKQGKNTGIGKGKNLIVLQIEALQDFVIGLEYNGQEVTPNLNKLIAHNSTLYYDNYHQLLGRGNTSDAEFVSNNSLHPSMEEPTYTQYQENTFYGLPWLLRDNGYTSWAFHGYEKTFWNREDAYPKQGFQRFISEEDFKFDEVLGFGIRDEDFYAQTIEYLKELDSIDENPFHAFIVSLSSHTPFKMPKEYEVLDIKEEHKDNMVGDYLQSVHYADKAIGEFIDGLKEAGLYDNTVIAIYGDHFAISAAQEEAPLMTELLGRPYDFDEMMHIPLIIHVPGEDINETISTLGSQLDFYPTIVNIMGYDNTKGLVFGRDLTNYDGYTYLSPQTYMLKGSFIDDDILFEISRDGIFEHSRAVDRKTGKEIDVEEARDKSEKAIREIEKSNYILETDYFKGKIK